jgi:uncharacterized protein (TIGR00730 family)
MQAVCVFCGASPGDRPDYAVAARALAALLAQRGLTVIYGGGSIGLMGILADAALAAGGRVVGVLPEHLARREVAHAGVTEMHIVASMHERKALMARRADAFIALPGGLGTLEELFEVLTWAQLGLHGKPCALLNVNGYFDPMIAFLDDAVARGFVQPRHREMLLIDTDPARLLERIGNYAAPAVEKWLEPAQS